jgi:hypothetical protein
MAGRNHAESSRPREILRWGSETLIRENRLILLFLAFLSFVCLLTGVCEAAESQPKKILLLPFLVTPENPELQSFADHVGRRIKAALSRPDGKVTLEKEKVAEKLLSGREGPATDQEAQTMAAMSGADLVIYGFLSQEGTMYHMRAVMWDMQAGRGAAFTDLKVDNIHKLPGVLDMFVNSVNTYLHGNSPLPFYRTEGSPAGVLSPRPGRAASVVSVPRETAPWRSSEVAAALSGLDMGDLEGDSKNEAVFLERNNVTVSRFDNGNLVQLGKFAQPSAEYISTEIADVDGDGASELLLCYKTETGLESAIVRYSKGNFQVVATLPHVILRTIPDLADPKKKILVGQDTDAEDLFSGEMIRYRVVGSEITPDGKVQLPPGTLLLSYVANVLGKKPEFLQIILNQDQRLMVFDKENRLLFSMSDRIYGLERRIRLRFRDGFRTITYPGRLVAADTVGGGENELLLMKQVGDGSLIQALAWDGQQLIEKWKTVTSPGLITDFGIKDFKNQGSRSLVLILMRPGAFPFLTGPRSVVYAYDLVPQ